MADTKISDLTLQTTMDDADLGVGVDVSDTTQAASGTTKKWTWTTIKAFLKTYFDGIYANLSGSTLTSTTLTSPVINTGVSGTAVDTDGTLAANSDTKIPSQKAVKTYADALTRYSNLHAPEGFLLNGKISVSVASNNITVAIKTLAGADATATTPIYCNIGGTVRSITTALSVTKNAGTNWCNAGGAELATQEIDYFAYLGYNATDGVVIGFSRIPFASQYSDFSATSTNEKYCAISTITNAASTDYYDVVGRFAATLSAGAGYTWSVPTFTAINLIQRPIWETRWLTFSPAFTNLTVGNGTLTGRYKIREKTVIWDWDLLFGSTTSVSGSVGVSSPITTSEFGISNRIPIECYDSSASAHVLGCWIGAVVVVYVASQNYVVPAVLSSTVPFTWATGDELTTGLITAPIA